MVSFSQFCDGYCTPEGVDLALDTSRIGMELPFLASMEPRIQAAMEAMVALEGGAIANPDEKRMVGHYWLRDFSLIPSTTLRSEVERDDRRMRQLLADVHRGVIKAPSGHPFRHVLSIGIGGSALGPQLISAALGRDADDKMTIHYMDNTDPDGIERILARLGSKLGETLTLVISKSGGTPETRNGMLLAERAYTNAGLHFGSHAMAITGVDSKLDHYAKEGGWIARLPMYDWVGGRTSVMSAVGLLPVGLQGVDIDGFVAGARAMDVATRNRNTRENPAAMLALAWFHATSGKGAKDMVVLPYKDRLELFSRYLQQLIMESLGKEQDLAGATVEQGITVYGNKGSTDQHAYVQQLRDGVHNFFATFIEVLHDGGAPGVEVEPGITAGDYLSGFFQGTRRALADKGRGSVTLTVHSVTAQSLGGLIALFERAVGLYASLVHVNAYHQPGVEAGKKAAATLLGVQERLAKLIHEGAAGTAGELARMADADPEDVFRILQHLAANKRGVVMEGRQPATATFRPA